MNVKELKSQLGQLVSTARQALEESTAFNIAGETDKATAKFADYTNYSEQAKVIKAQIEAAGDLDSLVIPEPEAEIKTEKAVDPVRLPFSESTEEDPKEKEPVVKSGFDKPSYVLRYGEEDNAVKAVLNDVYGNDYASMRSGQQDAFNKYVRAGDSALDRDEEVLLKTMIMLPEQIRQDIHQEVGVSVIKATLQEALNDLGGYLVPEDYRVQMVKRLMGATIIRPLARVVTTNRDAVEYPKLEGGNDRFTSAVRVTWVDEVPSDANVAETNPTFGMVRIPVHTVMARTDISRNMLEDSAFNVINEISTLFAEAAAIDEDVQFITGIGGGTPLGVLGERAGAELVPVAGVETVDTGASSTMQADGLIDLAYALPAQYRANAVMVASRTTHRDIRKLKDTQNRYIWEDNYQTGQPATILGYPALESESIPAVAADSYPVIFGDFSGYLIADRIGMTIERVTDVTTVGRNKVALFMRRRLGGQVIDPWKFKAQKVSA